MSYWIIVMVFRAGVGVEPVCPRNEAGTGYLHILMGEPYARLTAAPFPAE